MAHLRSVNSKINRCNRQPAYCGNKKHVKTGVKQLLLYGTRCSICEKFLIFVHARKQNPVNCSQVSLINLFYIRKNVILLLLHRRYAAIRIVLKTTKIIEFKS